MGYVYTLSNPSMPGLVKIGCTDRFPNERVSELSGSTGVPTPFVLEYVAFAEDHEALERYLHSVFHESRVNGLREFFQVPVQHVVQAVWAQQMMTWDEPAVMSFLKSVLAKVPNPLLRPQNLDAAIAVLLRWEDEPLMKLVDAIARARPIVRSVL